VGNELDDGFPEDLGQLDVEVERPAVASCMDAKTKFILERLRKLAWIGFEDARTEMRERTPAINVFACAKVM
jgi:hypothetical protein